MARVSKVMAARMDFSEIEVFAKEVMEEADTLLIRGTELQCRSCPEDAETIGEVTESFQQLLIHVRNHVKLLKKMRTKTKDSSNENSKSPAYDDDIQLSTSSKSTESEDFLMWCIKQKKSVRRQKPRLAISSTSKSNSTTSSSAEKSGAGSLKLKPIAGKRVRLVLDLEARAKKEKRDLSSYSRDVRRDASETESSSFSEETQEKYSNIPCEKKSGKKLRMQRRVRSRKCAVAAVKDNVSGSSLESVERGRRRRDDVVLVASAEVSQDTLSDNNVESDDNTSTLDGSASENDVQVFNIIPELEEKPEERRIAAVGILEARISDKRVSRIMESKQEKKAKQMTDLSKTNKTQILDAASLSSFDFGRDSSQDVKAILRPPGTPMTVSTSFDDDIIGAAEVPAASRKDSFQSACYQMESALEEARDKLKKLESFQKTPNAGDSAKDELHSKLMASCHSIMDVVGYLKEDVFMKKHGVNATEKRLVEADQLLNRFQRARQKREKIQRQTEDSSFEKEKFTVASTSLESVASTPRHSWLHCRRLGASCDTCLHERGIMSPGAASTQSLGQLSGCVHPESDVDVVNRILARSNAQLQQQLLAEDGENVSSSSSKCPLCSRRELRQLDNDLWRLEIWMDNAERRIAEVFRQRAAPSFVGKEDDEADQAFGGRSSQRQRLCLGGDLAPLEEAFQEVHELTLDLKSHEPLKASVESLAGHLIAKSGDVNKVEELKGKLAKIRSRWSRLEADTAECLRDLGLALYEHRDLHRNLDQLMEWVQSAEMEIRNNEPIDPKASPESLANLKTRFQEMQLEAGSVLVRIVPLRRNVDQVLGKYHQLQALQQQQDHRQRSSARHKDLDIKQCLKAQKKLHDLDERLGAIAKLSDAYVSSLNDIILLRAAAAAGEGDSSKIPMSVSGLKQESAQAKRKSASPKRRLSPLKRLKEKIQQEPGLRREGAGEFSPSDRNSKRSAEKEKTRKGSAVHDINKADLEEEADDDADVEGATGVDVEKLHKFIERQHLQLSDEYLSRTATASEGEFDK
ncbi:unnamed protein product [Notodromas monacha]|uniref:Uncharacterized protein n=1 Tax=Notodromas monacha TaxID=399045 RepID=A0A7R9BR80_9CRUS|nr:unnamed protein product [Notodromas monacha]CAG0919321.1 unnamed protein product [Notodromas monacha]